MPLYNTVYTSHNGSLEKPPSAAGRVLTGVEVFKSKIVCKILLLTYKVLEGQAPSYPEKLIAPYDPNRPLSSQNAG